MPILRMLLRAASLAAISAVCPSASIAAAMQDDIDQSLVVADEAAKAAVDDQQQLLSAIRQDFHRVCCRAHWTQQQLNHEAAVLAERYGPSFARSFPSQAAIVRALGQFETESLHRLSRLLAIYEQTTRRVECAHYQAAVDARRAFAEQTTSGSMPPGQRAELLALMDTGLQDDNGCRAAPKNSSAAVQP